MKLAALTNTRIDGDVIEEFLRHTARFVDHHYVVLLGASDSTRTIVDALIAEGLPITLWLLANSASIEGDFTLAGPYARFIFMEQACDFIFLIDADEFILAPSRERLEEALLELPTGAHAKAYWATYLPTITDDESETRILARITHRRRYETHNYAKIILNRWYLHDRDAVIGGGNHLIHGSNSVMVDLRDIRLAHFPVRSVLQMQCKALLGTTAILASGHLPTASPGSHWQRAFELLEHNQAEWSPADLIRLASNYLGESSEVLADPDFVLLDPIPAVEQIYPATVPRLVQVALALARDLALAYGTLRNAIMPPPLDPATVWPDFPAAVGDFDLISIVDAEGASKHSDGSLMVASAGAHLHLSGWIALPDPLVPAIEVFALFPGRKIAIESGVFRSEFVGLSDSMVPERSGFFANISLDDFDDGVYQIRVATRDNSGRWYVLRQSAVFEKSTI